MQDKEVELKKKKVRILYIDMAYTLKMVHDRGLQQEFDSRDCDGYFEHVWGVHPLATLADKKEPSYAGFKISQVEFSESQTVIEGSRYIIPPLNIFFRLIFLYPSFGLLFI